MNFNFNNIHTRKILFEKCIYSTKNFLFGLKFCSYKSNKESLLIVKLCDLEHSSLIKYNQYFLQNLPENLSERFEPIKIEIIESIDNNGSYEFCKWLHESLNNPKNTYGVDMFLFSLTSHRYKPILSLRGCALESTFIKESKISLGINFFAYELPKENS